MRVLLIVAIATVFLGCHSRKVEDDQKKGLLHPEKQETTEFDPDGYYFSKQSISIGRFQFGCLEIFTKDVEKQEVNIRLESRNGSWIDIPAAQFSIQKDKSSIQFEHPAIGQVLISGSFTGKEGPMSDEVRYETVVFKGELKHKDKIVPLEMTWFEGD